MIRYYVVRADGSDEAKEAEELTLDLMQAEVGGHVEAMAFADTVMLVDEDGLHKQLPMNLRASRAAGTPIVGPAVFVPRNAGWG